VSANPHPAAELALELRGITKRFGEVLANDQVNLQVRRGTIHGIVGENGAGKSTIAKIIYGLLRPDAGTILLNGTPVTWSSPAAAIAAGLGMVHQHFMLAGPYSALENIILGAEPLRAGLVDRAGARVRLDALALQYGLSVPWEARVEDLSVGLQQRLEILKLLYREANLLILDEPTAVLTPPEATALFANLKRLRDQGKTILLVTHKLNEIIASTDRVTIFRGGRVTGEMETCRTSAQELANLMVGRSVVLSLTVAPAKPRAEQALEVESLSVAGKSGGRPRLSAVSFSVRHREILGIAGVDGNGQSELLEAVLNPAERGARSGGTVRVLGLDVTEWSRRKIRSLGVAVIPQDRVREGLLLEEPVEANFALGLQRRTEFSRWGVLNWNRVRRTASRALDQYAVRPRDLSLPAGKLSGGNQQKLVVAREFERQPRLLLAAEPTRGVDIGAIELIHQNIVRARDSGAGVLLISSDLDEVLALSDRILVLYEGRIVAEYKRGQVSYQALGLSMGGGSIVR
jgi:simple sugar transport system ATP-binding protein